MKCELVLSYQTFDSDMTSVAEPLLNGRRHNAGVEARWAFVVLAFVAPTGLPRRQQTDI